MKIQINKELVEIKTALNLNVKEYCELQERITQGMNGIDLLIQYLSVVTGIKASKYANIHIEDKTIERLIAYIGIIPEDFTPSELFYYKRDGKTLYAKTLNWRTLGVRSMMEHRKEENVYKLMVYQLALYLSGNYDNEKVEQIYNELQDYNAIDVFSFITFFLLNCKSTDKKGINNFQRLLKKAGINTAI